MEARQRLAVPAWVGLVLSVVGVLALVGAYFLLPLWEIPASVCEQGICENPFRQMTGWETTLNLLTTLPSSTFGNVALLVMFNLPLLAAVTIVGCHVGLLVHPHRTFAVWTAGVWGAGIVAIVLMFFLLSLFSHPWTGYLAMWLGYAVLWGSNILLRFARPEMYAAL